MERMMTFERGFIARYEKQGEMWGQFQGSCLTLGLLHNMSKQQQPWIFCTLGILKTIGCQSNKHIKPGSLTL